MKPERQIPYYAPDGTSLGYRAIEAAGRLIAAEAVHPSYGRKGHLKAIWAREHDGSNPVQTRLQTAPRYSYPEPLGNGRRCWRLRRLDLEDEDGERVDPRGVFLRVLHDCLVA
ncbi:MAG TPA: hypothetical protein PKJ41_10720 [Bryobacteraceae bacterium]|nr:hypothetical protein [Bryobacteraceae bacterium]HPT26227.1 hypothetical protein [Bryobacteraceae bacterium]